MTLEFSLGHDNVSYQGSFLPILLSYACRTDFVRMSYARCNDSFVTLLSPLLLRTTCVQITYGTYHCRTVSVRMSYALFKTPPSCSGPPWRCVTVWQDWISGAGHPHVGLPN